MHAYDVENHADELVPQKPYDFDTRHASWRGILAVGFVQPREGRTYRVLVGPENL